MTGQYTPIISIDYNSIQSKISQILGVGSGSYGYGQDVLSSQATPRSVVSEAQWKSLKTDLLRARQHQTGNDESGSLPNIESTYAGLIRNPVLISSTDIIKFSEILTLIEEDRLITPPSSQSTRENLVVGIRTTPWNNTLVHTVNVQFLSEEAARWYFNTGSTIEFSISRIGGSVSPKNSSWSLLLSNIGTVTFGREETYSNGSGSGSLFGYYNLTTTDSLIFQKLEVSGSYNSNRYSIYARLGNDQSLIVFTIEVADTATGIGDENVDGTLTSTVQVFRASGGNVSVNRPAASSTMTGVANMSGGEVIITPPPVLNPNYQITRDLESIGEGETTVTFTITTQNVLNGTKLYWSILSTAGITANDFTDNTLTGSVIIFGNTATVTKSALKDEKTEGTETFYLELREGWTSGPILATSPSVEIIDLSTDPIPPGATYSITPDATILVEGDPEGVTFVVDTTGVPDGTTLFWTTLASSAITIDDFVDNVLIGPVTIKNNTGSFKRIIKADRKTEGSEVFTMELRTTSSTGPVVAISEQLLILDVSLTPSITLDVSPLFADEDSVFSLEMSAFFLPPDSKLFLTMSGSLSDSDFVQLSGPIIDPTTREFKYASSPTVWTFQIRGDEITEGPENAVWQVRLNSKTSEPLATSQSLTVNDTSRTKVYSLVSTPATVNEGATLSTTLTTENVNTGTILYLRMDPSSQAKSVDMVYASGPTIGGDGAFTVTGPNMTWEHTIVADQLTEGTETFNWSLGTNPGFTKIATTGNLVTINDTSLTPSSYNIVAYPVEVVEGEIVTGAVTLTIMDSPVENLVAYWTMDEADGATLNDKVDNPNQIATGSSIGWGTINGASAALFNGTSGSFAVVKQDSEKLKLTAKAGSAYTIEAWIYPTGPGQDSTYGGEIINHDTDFEVARKNDGRIIVASDWAKGTDVNLPGGGWIYPPVGVAVAPLNTATHVAVVIDNTTLKIYLNGALAWTKTGLNRLSSNTPTRKTYIGNRHSKNQGFKGYISNLRVWNIARTAQQIAAWWSITSYPGVQANPNIISSKGNSVAFNVTSTGVPNGTTVYWNTQGVEPGLTAFDFTDGVLDGTVEINDNKGLITRTLSADATLEGQEHFTISLYSDQEFANILATSQQVTIEDTSVRANGSVEYTIPGPTAYAPYVVPSGVSSLIIEMAGGGGSGGYSYRGDPQAGGGGGGSGGFITRTINVTPGQQIKVNVGAGGIPTFNEVEYTRNGGTTSLAIGTTIGTVSYSGTPYPSASSPGWKNSTMKSYAVWLAGLYQRNIMRWDLYLTSDGTYTIKGAADDVMTMWIDGNSIFGAEIGGFNKPNPTSVSKTLSKGIHTIIISGKDTKGSIAGVAATISLGSNVIWHTRMGPDAQISAGTVHVSGGLQGNDGMTVGNIITAGRGGMRGMPAGQDGTIGEKVANKVNAHPGQSPSGTAWGGTAGTSHYGPGGEGGKGTQGANGQGYGAGGGGAGAPQKAGSNAKVNLGGAGVGGYIKISWGSTS